MIKLIKMIKIIPYIPLKKTRMILETFIGSIFEVNSVYDSRPCI
jgi:hypothetical protein